MGDNLILQGLLPYDRVWAITPDWKERLRSLSPELYRAFREDPRRFAELSRSGFDTAAPALALGILNSDIRAFGRSAKPGKRKPATADIVTDDDDTGEIEEVVAPAEQEEEGDGTLNEDDENDCTTDEPAPYDIVNGVALLSVSGPMSKKPTSAMWLFGGTATILLRRKLAHAMNNPRVGAILIDFDTPGGSVAGTADLADHIARINAVKPVEGFVPDLCASAGYWAISGCRKITVGRAALVGSIGCYMVVEDFSKMFNEAGVTVYVINAGKFKGAGEEGTEVTKEHRDEFQREVNDLNDEFRASIATGRKMNEKQLDAVNTGQVWKGQQLINLGLADAIGSYEDVLSRLASEVFASGKVKYSDLVPGASASRNSTGSRAERAGRVPAASLPLEGPGSGYPKTGDPIDAAIGAAQERIEAERLQLIEAVHTDKQPIVSHETQPEPGTGRNEGSSDPETSANDQTAPLSESAGNPTNEVTETMEQEKNNPAPPATATTPTQANPVAGLDPALVASLIAGGIVSVAALTELVALASDGKKARSITIGNIANFTTRIQGAEATDPQSNPNAVDFNTIYGGLPYDNLVAIEKQQRATYEAMMKHNAQITDPTNNPTGARVTQPATGLSAAILDAMGQQTPAGVANTHGVAPVDPDAMAARLNAARNGKTVAPAGK